MDELVHHCVREISFDGDLGCPPSRLQDFIVSFYTIDATHPQTVDDSFCAFVWSLIVQQPTVRVGTIPQGAATEVYIATQTSAKRKAAAKGEEIVQELTPSLNVVPNAMIRPLEDLKAEFGDSLRIAVDSDTSFAAITGSHLRSSKLSPMVYTALQLITRGREDGISVVDLGKKTKYDQKTCFYLVKQLIDLDLIVKKKKSGVGTNFVIHKYFYERDSSWQQIRNEEAQAAGTSRAEAAELQPQNDQENDENDSKVTVSFDPIDTRHLSSLPLVRARIVKLLRASHNNMHASTSMLVAIGFANPTRSDRRFFQARLRELFSAGIVEKVLVLNKKNSSTHTNCIRLLSSEASPSVESSDVVVETQPFPDDDKDFALEDAFAEQSGLKMNLTIHRQIADLLEEAGTRGMTLSELSDGLCHFDKRTIELLLARAERNRPPSHLSDLGIAGLMETLGRERRHRYYTIAAFRALVAREGLDDSATGYADIDFSTVGNFASFPSESFYEDERLLVRYTDSFKDNLLISEKKYKLKNPILADGSVKLGRPRKAGGKRKRDNPDDAEGEPAVKPRRGRPPKKPRLDIDAGISEPGEIEQNNAQSTEGGTDGVGVIIPKKRGRPPKINQSSDELGVPGDQVSSAKRKAGEAATLKRRGRPPKQMAEAVGPDHEEPRLVRDDEVRSASEDAPPKKRGRSVKQRPAVFTAEPGQQLPQTSNNRLESTALASPSPLTSSQAPLEIEFPDEGNPLLSAVPLESHLEEPRRSPRKRKPAVRDDCLPSMASTQRKLLPAVKPITQSTAGPSDRNHLNAAIQNEITPDISHSTGSALFEDAPTALHSPGRSTSIIPESSVPGVQGNHLTTKAAQTQEAPTRAKAVNVSHLRRENELYRVIQECEGIVTLQTKEFYDAHMSLVETMAQAGEPTSSPVGIRLDKRTAESTLNGMAARGRIKILKTSLITSTGAARPASIVYLPNVKQNTLNEFLADLGRTHSAPVPHFPTTRKIDEPLDYGSIGQVQRAALPLQLLQKEERGGDDEKERWSRNAARAAQLFTFDDATIREVLLAERTTLGQLYGFIVGKIMRVRYLHLVTLGFFDQQILSPRVVSLENRIIHLSLFYHDLQLSAFCSVIGVLAYDDELAQILNTSEGQATPVEKLPASLHASLQVGRARTRVRLLDLLESLRSLGLVTPLRPSHSLNAQYTCTRNGDHPTAFDEASREGWSTTASFNAPTYWRFNEQAPVHLWSQSETSPPFWKDMPVRTFAEAVEYWHHLDQACRNHDLPLKTPGPSVGSDIRSLDFNIGVARSLRRKVSWNGSYVLTWHQKQYLNRFVDRTTGDTPFQDDETGEAQLQNICWVVSAPREALDAYFGKARKNILKELEKVHQKTRRQMADEEAKKTIEAKALLQRKAAEARSQREKDWDEMLLHICSDPLKGSAAARMRRVRARFLESSTGRDVKKWEGEILQAIREVKISSKEVTPSKKPLFWVGPRPALVVPPPIVLTHSGKSIEALIAQQGVPRISDEFTGRKSKKKGKGKGKGTDNQDEVQPNPPTRRGRFQWNQDYDELARDASAIVRARCRDGVKIEWAALEQVFPAVPRNSVRQRVVALREIPGADAYLKRLEDRWYDIWIQHRGTENLPDDDPRSPSNFNLIDHVKFLRRHIDKNAIRVGFAAQRSDTKLPASIGEVDQNWEVAEKTNTGPLWEFLWHAQVDEGREKTLLKHPFTVHFSEVSSPTDVSTEDVYLAESAVKMIFGAPSGSYEPSSAARLLHSIGEEPTAIATSNLLSRGVLSKTSRNPKVIKPGRTLKISEMNQNAMGGSIPHDVFQDASALEDIALNEEGDWRQWPLLATDGDTAALLQLISEDKVEFRIDTSQAQAARPALDWNSKKADDDQIETVLSVRFHDLTDSAPTLQSSESSPSPSHMELDAEPSSAHGLTLEGHPACCKKESIDLIDCAGCLELELSAFLSGLEQGDGEIVQRIWAVVRNAGANGVSKDRFLTIGPRERVLILVDRMYNLPIPLLFWTGYLSPVLVSSLYLQAWTILISENPMTRIFPRRWIDITGTKIPGMWEAALKVVIGVVTFRPGISHAELRWRLRPLYDRQEINDILRYLLQDGALKRRWNSGLRTAEPEENEYSLALNDEEEKSSFWFIGEKHWYRI